jgi:excinuclease ABC subunit C
MNRIEELLEKAQSLPTRSGCYLMKDKNHRVIYVGKAKKLKNRVMSYFNQSAKSIKTQFLVSNIVDFEFIITKSDAESFVLENNLIKEHSPKYNLRLRDDKSYPLVKINWNEEAPKLEYVRRPKKDKGVEIFGPFPVGSNISQIIRVLNKSFKLRDCSLHEFKTRKTACLLYQMKQCSAPCVKYISKDDYKNDIEMARDFFLGKRKSASVINYLNHKMIAMADAEEFEMAGLLRDYIKELQEFLDKSLSQHVENLGVKDVDVWGIHIGEIEVDLSLYQVRSGNLLGQKNFHFNLTEIIGVLQDELVQAIFQYYCDLDESLPEELVIDLGNDEKDSLQEALQTIHDEKYFKLKTSSKRYKPIMDMCMAHAQESQNLRRELSEKNSAGLDKLQELLGLKNKPQKLECYDIAILQGSSPAASQVVSIDGNLEKSLYRHYHMTELPEGNNDFAMMKEVITRRIKHGDFPDVFVIDGGVAQVNTVLAVLKEFHLEIPVVGIAKSKDLTRGEFQRKDSIHSDERLVIPGRSNPYILNKSPALMKIIVSLRNEAHRFSRRLHHKQEKKRILKTWIDEVDGISEKMKQIILTNLTVDKDELSKMTVIQIQSILGINLLSAKKIYQFLHLK